MAVFPEITTLRGLEEQREKLVGSVTQLGEAINNLGAFLRFSGTLASDIALTPSDQVINDLSGSVKTGGSLCVFIGNIIQASNTTGNGYVRLRIDGVDKQTTRNSSSSTADVSGNCLIHIEHLGEGDHLVEIVAYRDGGNQSVLTNSNFFVLEIAGA